MSGHPDIYLDIGCHQVIAARRPCRRDEVIEQGNVAFIWCADGIGVVPRMVT